jgi:hypothetical protein
VLIQVAALNNSNRRASRSLFGRSLSPAQLMEAFAKSRPESRSAADFQTKDAGRDPRLTPSKTVDSCVHLSKEVCRCSGAGLGVSPLSGEAAFSGRCGEAPAG